MVKVGRWRWRALYCAVCVKAGGSLCRFAGIDAPQGRLAAPPISRPFPYGVPAIAAMAAMLLSCRPAGRRPRV
jgi:hypothetical protein